MWKTDQVCQWFTSLGAAYAIFGMKAQTLGVDGGLLLSLNADNLVELGCTGKLQQTKITQELDKLRVANGLISPSSASSASSPRSGGGDSKSSPGTLTVIQFSELGALKELASGHYATYDASFLSSACSVIMCLPIVSVTAGVI